ncbi:coiled-coil domain-containing protein 62 isoform X3 [Melanotaenia boesemani]|uniref:coiled-coil domain-containing protein 62 isoform X3 n=1 Tax=Melanotaenia boesemani TaxID=1250792 RepID=UPI001C0568CF|nr:coiled-coil domain-containing protein 62 isoform X3 [Melanotaenia boesemani]
MDEGRRLLTSTGSTFGRAACSRCSDDVLAELWHSTPVKREDDAARDGGQASGITNFKMDNPASQWGRGPSTIPADTCFPHSVPETEFPVKDLSGSTIRRQRRELQLLMAELKDRERELNAMAASHYKQHQAWVEDRQRVLMLGQKCARLEEELQKRTEVIGVLTTQVCVVETREKVVQKELSKANQQLCELEKEQRHISEKCQDYEEKNQSLSSTVMALSTQVGSLQVKEEELSSMLKLKDKDVTEASSHLLELSGQLRDLETALKESRSQESKLLRDLEDNKRRHKETKHEVTRLKEELQQQVTQSSTQREEIIRLKQELQLLHTDLALTGEGDSWKDELLELSRSKQERIMSELRCLQQMCENQRNDLQLLRLNQESSRETLREKTSQGLLSSQDLLTCNCADRRSPSSHRGKNLKPVRDSLPTADPQHSTRELGAHSAHLTDGVDHLSSCSLHQLLDESSLLMAASESSSSRRHSCLQHFGPTLSCGTSDPLYFHEYQTPHHLPNTPILKQTSETPPKACPRHGSSQPASHVDGLI